MQGAGKTQGYTLRTAGIEESGIQPYCGPVDEEKIIDLETRIAHQEYTVATLNEVLTDQQAQLTKLSAQVEALTERVRALSAAVPSGDTGDPADEKPPHY